MKVRLAYGTDGLEVDFPDDRTTVVNPSAVPTAPDPVRLVRDALRAPIGRPPLRSLVRPGHRVAISICDGTRPQPRALVLAALLAELETVVAAQDIVILIATGTHRGNTPEEIRAMVGDDVFGRVSVVNHDARDDATLRLVGHVGDDIPVWLNSRWLAADVRVTTGVVEPHFFAGFSGGPKMVAPGLAGLQTTLRLHDATHIGHPDATWGITRGNPVHDDIRAIAATSGVDFSLDVVLDRDKRVVGAFSGELFAMHERACGLAREISMVPVDRRFDVVVSSNAGFPLDQNLYQSVKGMSAAATIVATGGSIILAAECRDGFPDHGEYRGMLAAASSPADLLDRITTGATTTPDQWQVQIQARVQAMAEVFVRASFLTDEDLREAHLQPVDDIAALVRRRLARAGPAAGVCVLPEGPMTIPYLVGHGSPR